ncbi:hypothetical protein MNEG_5526 [Monoraphidium neglectum]|uniref:Uncharacterized protein n=1 Tax=Monoraphidium neglectum TaxID=145388 RepID=A0A0D2L609_9CHLO|nr:hypothetical protein MNEG_5526 [Monoraphidium neglectum]KIZ02434.1 hypothetical protein MNEG_5526 [Monoraphidium neglectum]|eukprot:XP_013901453.1 hypothetical protein MNEG_5526 [Monoraphidium neglectum]
MQTLPATGPDLTATATANLMLRELELLRDDIAQIKEQLRDDMAQIKEQLRVDVAQIKELLSARATGGRFPMSAASSTSSSPRANALATASTAGGLAPAGSPCDSQELDQDFVEAVRLIRGAAAAYGVPADFGKFDELTRAVPE